jgi:hypothetical protein
MRAMDRDRPWVMRVGKSGMASVLVVTSRADALETLADELAGAGYYAFVALPSAVSTLAESTVFDLILVLRDVADFDRETVKRTTFLHSSNDASGLVLTHVGEDNLVSVLRERLDPMRLIDE